MLQKAARSQHGTVHEDILASRWQLAELPPDKAALSQWPGVLPHCSSAIFRSHAEAIDAHEAAPRWHVHGDHRCTPDSCVAVALAEQGREHLRTISQMQMGRVRVLRDCSCMCIRSMPRMPGRRQGGLHAIPATRSSSHGTLRAANWKSKWQELVEALWHQLCAAWQLRCLSTSRVVRPTSVGRALTK